MNDNKQNNEGTGLEPAASSTFVNCVSTIKTSKSIRQVGEPFTVILARVAREPGHVNGCGPVP
jgi:hypothetical protein